MANSYIDFTCKQQELTLPNPPIVAEGASVLYARFDLCPKWDGLALYARFKNMAAVYDVPISDGCALIPWEVVKYTGFEVSIFGEDAEGGRLTSAKVFVDVKRGIDFDGAPPIPYSPSLIQAFEAKVQSCIDIAAAVRADAEAGAFDGDPFTVSAIYSSVAEMEADESGAVAVGQFAVIDAGTVDDPDNAKLYQRTAEGWRFIVDMSGASGTLEGVGSGSAGQVLTMQPDGTPAWNDAPDGLPEGGQAGQVLTLEAGGAVWADAPESGTPVDFPILVNQGGTGATNAEAARANLDVYGKSDVYTKAEVDEMAFGGGGSGGGGDVATVELVTKAGIIQPYSGTELPEGFLWCDGAAYSRTAYAQLFAAIGTTFGAGDGLTTFNVPDMRGRVPVGAGDGYSIGATGGEATHTLTVAEMPSHNHKSGAADEYAYTWRDSTFEKVGSIAGIDEHLTKIAFEKVVGAAGGNQPHNNMQPYTVVNYVISTGVSSFTEFVPIANGGTGASTAAGAREALGITRENLGVTLENLGAADYIVAEGTTGIWEWRKWASGKAECCCRTNFADLTCDQEWGGMYYTPSQYVGDYPFAFTKTPAIFTNLIGGRDGLTVLYGYGSATQPPKVYLVRPDKVTTAFDLACNFKAEGRWK